MKISASCRQCLTRLTCQAAESATDDLELRAKAIKEGLKTLDKGFLPHRVATELASEIHRLIRRVTANPDPYRRMKDRELKVSEGWFKEVRLYYGEDFRSCVKLSALALIRESLKDTSVDGMVSGQ